MTEQITRGYARKVWASVKKITLGERAREIIAADSNPNRVGAREAGAKMAFAVISTWDG